MRNGPGWKLTVDGYYDIVDQDPISPGRNLVNSVQRDLHRARQRGLHAGRRWERHPECAAQRPARPPVIGARWNGKAPSPRRPARASMTSWAARASCRPTRPVTEGTFGGGSVALHQGGPIELDAHGRRAGWGGNDHRRARGATCALRCRPEPRRHPARSRAASRRSPVLPQMEFRAGGINTVRGLSVRHAAWCRLLVGTGRRDADRGAGAPRAVLDAGWAGRRIRLLLRQPAGIGVASGSRSTASSSARGIIRFDFSRALTQRDTPGNSASWFRRHPARRCGEFAPVRASGRLLLAASRAGRRRARRLARAVDESRHHHLGRGASPCRITATWCPLRAAADAARYVGRHGVGILVRTVKLAPGMYRGGGHHALDGAGRGDRVPARERANFVGAEPLIRARWRSRRSRAPGWWGASWLAHGRPTGRCCFVASSVRVTAVPDTVRCESQAPPPDRPHRFECNLTP